MAKKQGPVLRLMAYAFVTSRHHETFNTTPHSNVQYCKLTFMDIDMIYNCTQPTTKGTLLKYVSLLETSHTCICDKGLIYMDTFIHSFCISYHITFFFLVLFLQ